MGRTPIDIRQQHPLFERPGGEITDRVERVVAEFRMQSVRKLSRLDRIGWMYENGFITLVTYRNLQEEGEVIICKDMKTINGKGVIDG